jgi:hypothetical protein
MLKCWPTEHPDIAGSGETPEVDALRSHPFNGQLPFARLHKHFRSGLDIYFNFNVYEGHTFKISKAETQ